MYEKHMRYPLFFHNDDTKEVWDNEKISTKEMMHGNRPKEKIKKEFPTQTQNTQFFH